LKCRALPPDLGTALEAIWTSATAQAFSTLRSVAPVSARMHHVQHGFVHHRNQLEKAMLLDAS
jgi:hypothetical protein